MTRAEKLGKSENVIVSLPQQHYDFLTYLAKISRLGTTRDEVARFLLVRQLDEMMEGGYPKTKIAEAGEPIPR